MDARSVKYARILLFSPGRVSISAVRIDSRYGPRGTVTGARINDGPARKTRATFYKLLQRE